MRQEEFNEKDCQGNVGRYSYAPANPIKKEWKQLIPEKRIYSIFELFFISLNLLSLCELNIKFPFLTLNS
jgi:hypothetical protein